MLFSMTRWGREASNQSFLDRGGEQFVYYLIPFHDIGVQDYGDLHYDDVADDVDENVEENVEASDERGCWGRRRGEHWASTPQEVGPSPIQP